MRIISQNGDRSIDFDSSTVSINNEAIMYKSTNDSGWLGTYETVERAGEVFMEMHNQWQRDWMTIFEMPIK